ncbi:MAG: PH domain-containing protein [Patescibacteria group bacterium]
MLKLNKDEKIILDVRKHWFVIFGDAFMMFIVAALPAILFMVAVKYFPRLQKVNIGNDLIYLFSFFYSIWLLLIWTIFFVRWTDYYLDVWYITSDRIVAINQKGMFRREIIDLRFEKIQDTTVELNGIIPTLLNFGTIHVQTAGEGREIILRNARNPQEAKKIILLQHAISLERNNMSTTSI